MRVTHVVATAMLGAGLGVQVFLSFQLAPLVFRLLDRPTAVSLMEGLFPSYYGFGLATTAIALGLALILAWRAGGGPLRWGVVVLLAIALGGTIYAGQVLLPQAHAARLRAQTAGPGNPAPLEFSRLHRLAVAVNMALFGVSALALGLQAAATPPR